MVCNRCGKENPEQSVICAECGAPMDTKQWESLTPEERARKLWIQREKQRRKKKNTENTSDVAAETEQEAEIAEPVREEPKPEIRLEPETPAEPELTDETVKSDVEPKEQIEVQPVDSPMTQAIREMVAELAEMPKPDEPQETAPKAELVQELEDITIEPESVREVELDTRPSAERTVERQRPAEEKAEKPVIRAEKLTSKREPVEKPAPIARPRAVDEPTQVLPLGTDGNSSVRINVEEALASMPEQEKDDFIDIRIPQIYAQAKYVPENSAKWAQKAAADEENDWEGFDPDASTYLPEEDERSHPLLVVFILLILAAAVGLAVYSCMTSDLFTLF